VSDETNVIGSEPQTEAGQAFIAAVNDEGIDTVILPRTVAAIEAEAVATYLASPEAERALAEALLSVQQHQGDAEERPDWPLELQVNEEWWLSPADFAQYALAAWREALK
jgi:hypothetical protein